MHLHSLIMDFADEHYKNLGSKFGLNLGWDFGWNLGCNLGWNLENLDVVNDTIFTIRKTMGQGKNSSQKPDSATRNKAPKLFGMLFQKFSKISFCYEKFIPICGFTFCV